MSPIDFRAAANYNILHGFGKIYRQLLAQLTGYQAIEANARY